MSPHTAWGTATELATPQYGLPNNGQPYIRMDSLITHLWQIPFLVLTTYLKNQYDMHWTHMVSS